MAIDDHSRVGFNLVLADETANNASAFVLAARRYYKTSSVKIKQIMTDTCAAYTSRRFERHQSHERQRPRGFGEDRKQSTAASRVRHNARPWLNPLTTTS